MIDFNYNTPYEENINYMEKMKGKKNYLLFLRYYGCTVCQLDIMEFSERYIEFKEKDVEITIALQSDRDLLRTQLDKEPLPFEIICDPDQTIYKKLNIRGAYSMTEMISKEALEKISTANRKGLKHGKYEGNEQQLPAVFLINEDGIVEYSHYGKDIADLPSIDEMLQMI